MEFISEHPWRKTVTQRLAPEQEKHPIATDNSDWEYIENEAAKIGTISHETVNIGQVQDAILKLLSDETKDFRLIAHFVNTLQRSSKPDNILLAIALLADYIEIYWNIAAPQKLKKRIVQMMIQRFTMAKNDFHTHAIQEQRDESTTHFIRLKQTLQDSYPDICDDIDKLIVGYAKASTQTQTNKLTSSSKSATVKNETTSSSTTVQSVPETELKVLPEVTLDPSSEQAWRRTLLKVIEIENSRMANQPIVFQLRRHIVWFNINTPVANNGLTTVPSVPAEKVNEYEQELSRPTVELWQKIENTIAYSPYWFDGHFMSAQIAGKLGYSAIADIIKNELLYFLERCPDCKTLQYNNGQPFASEQTLKWLNKKALSSSNTADNQSFTLFESDGLEAAITHLEESTSEQPRDMSYAQLQTVQLLNKAGCYKLAKMQLGHLKEHIQQLDVKTWEPVFFEKCDEIEAQIGNKE